MTKTFQFPVWLKGSPEEQAAEAERQSLALASHSRAKMTEAERLVGRGRLLEETARGNLEQAKGRDKEARTLAENQLADALAMQGRYAEAVEIHTDKHRRRFFREVIKALEKPDNEKCHCADRKAKIDSEELAITPRFEREKLFSPIHGELVSLVECSKCGHRNARPLRSRLIPQQAALSQSEAAKKPVLSDAQVLNAKTQ